MSKERLEEIKQRLVLLHNAADVDDETKRYIFEYLKVEWLIERVQELEQDVREWEIVNEQWEKINTQIAEQNKHYREALEFYADTNNYKLKGKATISSLVFDGGIRARKALEGEK